MDENDNLKITDFGLSTLAFGKHGKTQVLTTTCGTPNYVAPEVLREKGYEGFKADIWSCGVILFVMLAGYLPFEDDDVNELFKKIESGKFKYPPYFSKSVKDLLSKMLQVNPKKRINMDGVTNHKWFKQGLADVQEVPHVVLKPSDDEISKALNEDFHDESEEVSSSSNVTFQDAFAIANEFLMKNINTMTSKVALNLQADNIRRNTRIVVKGAQQFVVERLVEALKKCKASPKLKNTHEIKAFAYGDRTNDIITITIVVSQTIEKSLSLVEILRGRGGILEFHQLYRKITSEIRDIMISSQPVI